MRIIGGIAHGRRLRTLRGEKIRPTADRVREALFNILGEKVSGCRFLDLFAGSGSVGIEALSRGAAEAVFVEQDTQARRILQHNLEPLGWEDKVRIYPQHILSALEIMARHEEQFEIIFADPPYYERWPQKLLPKLKGEKLLAPGGWFIIEHSVKEIIPLRKGQWWQIRTEKYGDTVLSFYIRKEM